MVLEKLNYLIEGITKDLVIFLVEDQKISMEDAIDIVYNSKIFEKLNDFQTHLYYESSAYIYELLKEEIEQSTSL